VKAATSDFGHNHVSNSQRGKDGARKRPDIDDASIWIQAVQRLHWLLFVSKLTVIVVLDNDGVAPLRPGKELQAAFKCKNDTGRADAPGGHLEGMDIRMYNPRSHQWSVYWTSSDSPSLGVSVVGEFKNGRGEFFDQETYQNRAILVRYLWSEIKEDSWRWEQAFSVDGGKTWETNWINTCVREK
jgi:hypothetical protein